MFTMNFYRNNFTLLPFYGDFYTWFWQMSDGKMSGGQMSGGQMSGGQMSYHRQVSEDALLHGVHARDLHSQTCLITLPEGQVG